MSGLPMPEPGTVAPEIANPAILDIQHDTDPADDHGPARHIPHVGHTAMLLGMIALFLIVLTVSVPAVLHLRGDAMGTHPGVGLLIEALTYVLTLAVSWRLFAVLWDRPFSRGLEWNGLAARRHWMAVVSTGVALCLLTLGGQQIVQRFLPQPKDVAIEKLMHTPGMAWSVTLMAVALGPLMEEIVFRGFLLPSMAIAYDWLLLERTPAGLQRWQSSTRRSTGALWFGAIFSSIFFAVLHAAQVNYAWAIVGLLFCVSLVLSWARLRFHSVACSTLMHAAYNAAIFLGPLIVSQGYRHLDRLKT